MYFDAWATQLSGFLSLETAEKFINTVASSLHYKKKKIPKTIIGSRKAASITAFIPPDQIIASSGKGDIQWEVSGAINKEWTG